MRNIAALSVVDTGLIGLIDQMMASGGAFTLGGAAHASADGPMDRRDRVAGVSPVGMKPRSGLDIGGIALGTASLSGAAARSEHPEAMLARGSRVTGSGGAALQMPPTARAGRRMEADGRAVVLSSGASVCFGILADFQPEQFL